MSYPGPKHYGYELLVFDYLNYPNVLVEINCFQEDGTASNCYQYQLVWRTTDAYDGWVAIAEGLVLTGQQAARLMRMWDALNNYLRSGPKQLGGSNMATWTLVQKVNTACLTYLMCYWSYEELTGGWLDHCVGLLWGRSFLKSQPGRIGEGVYVPPNSTSSGNTSLGPIYTNAKGDYLYLFMWFKFEAVSIEFGLMGVSIQNAGFQNINFGIQWNGIPNNLQLSAYSASGGVAEYDTNVTAGAWHFLMIGFRPNNGIADFIIDGQLLFSQGVTTSGLADGPVQVFWGCQTFGPTCSCNFDELGIFQGREENNDLIDALYNNGAGRTWPAVGAIIG